jgi:hypothetical protein
MILGKVFDRFARFSPVTVMMRGVLEYVLPPARLDELFVEHAEAQYQDELLFSTVVHTLGLAVNGVRKSVNAAYLASQEDFTVSVHALYDKLKGIEPQVSQALVREAATKLAPVVQALRAESPPLLPGYRVKIIDGNHLTGTDHRVAETRTLHSSPLPGQALVVLDPQLRMLIDVFPCEDAYAQERSLLDQVIPTASAGDLWIGDRNFCCTRFVFGVHDRGASFLLRQHICTLYGKRPLGRARKLGRCETGLVYEQLLEIRNPEGADPDRQMLTVRRITIKLDRPTEKQEAEVHLVTNVPAEAADAIALAELYRERWTIENVFQELGQSLRSEVNTLCYPKAALLAFCVALLTYDVLSVLKAALRSAQRDPSLLTDISSYYLGEEIAATYGGLMIAIEPRHWTKAFARLTAAQVAVLLKQLAKNIDVSRFKKHKRTPKKPPPQRIGGFREKHVSTARLIDQRTSTSKIK